MEFQKIEDMRALVRVRPSSTKLNKVRKYEDSFDFGFNAESTDYERRIELLSEIMVNVRLGITDSAPILTDIRTRDGFIRSVWDISQLPDSDTELADIIAGLLVLATASTGEVRGQCLTLWVGFHFMLGNLDAFSAVQGLPEVEDISLFQLLSIAHSHGVPSSVWGASLEAVSLEACLTGVG